MFRKIEQTEEMFRIEISNGTNTVLAPLHDDFGFTVGSEYTTPFDTGSMSGLVQKAFALTGTSAPVGLRMRKMYANPEPTEISFKMSFDAYYDAAWEVVIPVVTLVTMGLGNEMTDGDIGDKLGIVNAALEKYAVKPEVTVAVPDGTTTVSSKLNGLIKMINAPKVCTLRFGTFLTLDEVFITSTAVSFSNNLDQNGYPMSADVNVTCTLQTAPVADDVIRFFGGGV